MDITRQTVSKHQIYDTFGTAWIVVLITLAGLFAWRANKTLIRFGWV